MDVKRQLPDPRLVEARAPGRHDSKPRTGDGCGQRVAIAAEKPDRVCQVRSALFPVALRFFAVAGRAVLGEKRGANTIEDASVKY